MDNPYREDAWTLTDPPKDWWGEEDGVRFMEGGYLRLAKRTWDEGFEEGLHTETNKPPPIAIEHTGRYRTRGGWEACVLWIAEDEGAAWAVHLNPAGGMNSDPIPHSTVSGRVGPGAHPHAPPLFEAGHPADLVEFIMGDTITLEVDPAVLLPDEPAMRRFGEAGTEAQQRRGDDSDADIAESSGSLDGEYSADKTIACCVCGRTGQPAGYEKRPELDNRPPGWFCVDKNDCMNHWPPPGGPYTAEATAAPEPTAPSPDYVCGQ